MSLLGLVHPTPDTQRDWYRNIATRRQSVSLFADLSPDPEDQALAQGLELLVKPTEYQHSPTITRRPFEEAEYGARLHPIYGPWHPPFASRYSDGTWGVWYGADDVTTTLYETVHHWLRFLADSPALPFESDPIAERRVWCVACSAALLDFRPQVASHLELVDPSDYGFCQGVGRELVEQHYPGLITLSARFHAGEIVGVFTPEILHNPRDVCYLTYRWKREQSEVEVERTLGSVVAVIPES